MTRSTINRAFLASFLFLTTLAMQAQADSLLLTKKFQFKDGIYLSLNALHRNAPDYIWDQLDAVLTTSARTFVTKVVRVKTKSGETLDLRHVLALSLEGIPYVNTGLPAADNVFIFAGLKARGKISYFSYEVDTTEMVEISAYNPLTRKPFRKGKVPVKSSLTVEKIFYFPDGRIANFSRESLLAWIDDDKQLWNTVDELGYHPDKEKLFKCLLIYDDRNAFYLEPSAP